GAIAIETKDGFTHPGTRAEAYTGSFSRLGMEVENGGSVNDRLAWFVTASRFDEDGWRDYSPSEATQFFGNVAWQSSRSKVELGMTYADTDLIGNGAAPVQLLAADRSAIFTRPDQTRNELMLFSLKGEHAISERLTLSGNVFRRSSDIATYNGDDSDFEECEDLPGFMCEEEDDEEELVFDPDGAPIPASDAIEGATINRTDTRQDAIGVSLQAVWSTAIAGRDSQLVVGAVYDESDISFHASTELGALDSTRLAVPGGIFVGDSFTAMNADTENLGLYFAAIVQLAERMSLTVDRKSGG